MIRNQTGFAAVKLIVSVGIIATSMAFGATTKTWVGTTDNYLLTSGNWNPSGTPQANASDIMQWDGSQAGNLLLTNNQSGQFNNLDNSPGLFVNVTAGQTGSLTVVESSGGTGRIRLNGGGVFNVASGAGAVTFGNGSASDALGLVLMGTGGGATHAFTNNSANTVTFGSDVYYLMGGGGGHTMLLAGTGNFALNSRFQAQNSGAGLALTVGGSGTVSLGSASAPGTVYAGSYNNVTLNSGTLKLMAADALGTGNTLVLNGGNLDSAVANLVNSGNNAQTWGGNFTFVGTENLNLGSGAVSMSASRMVTVTAKTLEVDGVISGSGYSLTKSGAGTLLLGGANTYSGGTVVSNGVLKLGSSSAIPAGNVTVYSTLDLNGNNTAITSLGGTGAVDTVSGGTPTLTVSNGTFAGVIKNTSGSLALGKNGSGTLTLSGTNTYSGGTAVNAGSLLVNGSIGSAAVTVASGASLGGSGTIGGSVNWQSGSSGSFSLTPTTGAGSNSTPLTVSGSVTLNGNAINVNVLSGTPLGVGTYKLMGYDNTGSSGAFASGAPTYTGAGVAYGTASSVATSGGQVILTVIYTGLSTTWTNNGNGNWTAGANWSSNPSYPKDPGDAAFLGVGSAYTTVTMNSPISLAALTFTNANSFLVADAGNALTMNNPFGSALIAVNAGSSNAIAPAVSLATNLAISTVSGTSLALSNNISNGSGNQALTVSGPGTVVLSGNNTYGPASGSVGTVLSGGGVLQLGNANAIGAGDLSIASSATIRPSAAMTLANNIIAGSGTATMDDSGNNITLSGAITGGGALTKNGTGQLTLNGANSYAGDSTFNGGNVVLGNATAIPGGTGKGNVNLGDGVALNLNGNSVVLNGLNSSTNTASVDNLAGGTVTLTLGESGAYATFLGSLKNTTGTLNLVKDGTGTETLAGNNTYSGTTTVNVGTLQIGNGGTTGNVGPGGVSLTATNANLAFNLVGTNVYSGNIAGSGTVSLNNTNLNLWLTGNNTFTGNVTVNSGTLWITNPASLGTSPKTVIAQGGLVSLFTRLRLAGNITIGSGISFLLSYRNGVLVNDSGANTIQGPIGMPNGGGDPDIISSNGFLTLAGDISTVSGNQPRALTLDGPADGLVSGNVLDVGLPAASVTKTGSGTWTMTGSANNYSGATTVSNGTLIINGTLNGNTAFAVNGGTMLFNGLNNGTGSATIASGGTFGGTGTMFSPVTWQTGSTGLFTASASGYTPMTIYNAVTLNNNAITVFVDGGTPLPPGTYTLLSEPNIIYSITGSFATKPTITGAGIASGTTAFVTTTATEVRLTVVNSSVWTFNGNGNWTTGANWDSNPNFPNGAGQFATFGVGSSLITVNLDASETIGGIAFTNANSFVITNSANTLTLDNSGLGASVTVTAGSSNSIATPVTLNEATIASALTGTALTLPGNISGGGALTMTGNGVFTLAGNNTYSGNTTLNLGTNGGTLVLASTSAVGYGTLTIGGGQLDSSAPNLVNANNNAQNWNGSFTFLGMQNLDLGNGNVNLGATSTLNINSNTLAVGGSIGGSFGLTKIGPGTLVLGGANTFTGGFLITNGTVVISNDTAFGTGTLNLGIAGASAGLTIRSADSTARTIANSWSANAIADNVMAGTGDLTFSGPLASGNGEKHFVISNSVTTFSGTMSDGGAPSGPIVKAGPGKLVLSGNNAMTKQFRIDAGTLALGSTTAIGTGTLIINGGGLDSTVASLVNAGNNPQNWNGSFYFAGSQDLNMGAGAVTMNANTTITVSNNTLTVGGTVGGTGSLTKAGTGTLVLSANAYTNNTTVSAGLLELGLANLSTNSTVSVSNGVLQLDFSVTNQVAAFVSNGVSQVAGVYKAANTGGLITGTGALLVVPIATINPNPPVVQVSVSGSTMTLAWPTNAGWILQSNSVGLTTSSAWFNYPADGSVGVTNVNITVDPAKTNVFYRMVKP